MCERICFYGIVVGHRPSEEFTRHIRAYGPERLIVSIKRSTAQLSDKIIATFYVYLQNVSINQATAFILGVL